MRVNDVLGRSETLFHRLTQPATYSHPDLTAPAVRRNGQPTHVPGIQHPVHRDASPWHGGGLDDQPPGAAGSAVPVPKQAASLLVRRAGLLHAAEPSRIGRHSTESGMAVNENSVVDFNFLNVY